MTLHDALKEALDLADQGALTVYHLRDILGGKVRAVIGTFDTEAVIIAYPAGWELYLELDGTGVKAHMRHTLRPTMQVNVALLPYGAKAFRNLFQVAFEAMREEKEV